MGFSINAAGAGYGFAQLFGYAGPSFLNIGPQRTVLVDITGPEILGLPAMPGTTVNYSLPIPSNMAFAGYALSTQAVVFTPMAPPVPWALTNAYDLVVGY